MRVRAKGGPLLGCSGDDVLATVEGHDQGAANAADTAIEAAPFGARKIKGYGPMDVWRSFAEAVAGAYAVHFALGDAAEPLPGPVTRAR